MTGCNDPAAPPQPLIGAVTAVRQHAFTALLNGESPLVADIAETASRDSVGVAQGIAWLQATGALERDGDQLIGAHGLTRRETAHALAINGHELHTWCAFDAVAIPVALHANARATTTCPTCQRALVIDILDGELPNATGVLWLPTGPCTNVIADFCAHANLFCGTAHLDRWHDAAGRPPGRAVALADVAPLALDAWGDVAAHRRGR